MMMPVAMVGRATEVGELAHAWSQLAGRTRSPSPGRTAIVTGAAGSGKSLLAAAAVQALAPRPAVILSGQARVHSPAPYDWLAAVLCGRDTADLPVPSEALAWLAQHPDAPAYRYAPDALLRLAVRTVRALVGAGPAVLVVEDLHALDPASLNLVAELAAAPDLPALLLVTSRPPDDAVSPQLTARTLARLSGTPGAVRAHLGPLTPADVSELLDQFYPGGPHTEVATALCARTGGNPYWLTELLAAGRGTDAETLAYGPVPEHLRFLLDREPPTTAELTAREREVLSCLAAGMSNKQVARSLGISIRTVTVHVSNLLRKTRSASRTEAALWAVRHELTG